jgi:aryl-alcohol dehydrogenase-like predicted oxidoreductase
MGLGYKSLKRDDIMREAEDSLRRLGVEAIDLYQSHWDDPTTPFEETLEAYSRLMQQGKVKAIGASNLDAARLAQALEASRADGLPSYATLQPHYNLIERASFEGPLQDLCVKEGIGVIPYFSLAAGFLTGKYRSEQDLTKSKRGPGLKKYLHSRGHAILAALDAVSERLRATPAQVALAWLLHRPGVTAPIVGATKLEHLDDALAAEALSLGDDEMERLEEPYVPHPVSGIEF